MKKHPWFYFFCIQAYSLLLTAAGIFLLIAPCVMRSWYVTKQINQADWQIKNKLLPYDINMWSWKWLNPIYGNNEDGVTGPLWYNSTANPSAVAAYKWSALRNPSNNLRYRFQWIGGPFRKWVTSSGKWYFQLGWYPNGFPVISAGKVS